MQNRSNVWSALCIVTWLGAGCGSQASNGETTAPSTSPTAGAAGTAAPASTTPSSAAPTAQTSAAKPAVGASTSTPAATSGSAASTPAAAGSATPSTGASAAAPGAAPAAGTTPAAGATTTTDPAAPAGATQYPDLRGTCGITSGYPGDETCLPAPKPEEGIQIHVGPTNYEDQAEVAKYLMQPGQEASECWTFHTPNDVELYYQTYEFSGRAGTHHVINTMYNTEMADGGFGACADPGTGTNGNIIDNLPGASKAHMPRGNVAPENADLGRKIPPHVASQADMHYYNFTDKPILREFWMNIYTVDKSVVKRQADQIRAMGGISWQGPLGIAPGTMQTYSYECAIPGDGQILNLLGHYHAHGKKFTASIRHANGMTDKVFEMYDFQDPAQFEYNSVAKNPAFSDTAAGATTGTLNVKGGDTLLWDCFIVNDSDVTLTYTNEVKTGEMCNLWGSSYGFTALNCVLP